MIRYAVSDDGLRLAYEDRGAGAPLVCLPGLTRNMEDFEPVVAAFSERARIIRMDFRGRGASDHAPDPMSYNVPQEARDVLALLDHLGLDKVAILGTSRGGLVAMMLAATAKERLSGVVLNDVGPVIEPGGLDAIMDYIGRRPGFATLAEGAAALPASYAPDFRNVPPDTWADMARRIWREEEDGLHLRYDPRLREAVAPAFDTTQPAPDLWPLFDALDGLPLALIRGANSNLLSRQTTAEMRRRRPDMLVAEIPDRGHVPFLDEPGAVALISEFLNLVS